MRGFVLLILGGALIWGVLNFFPQDEELDDPSSGETPVAVVDEPEPAPAVEPIAPKVQPVEATPGFEVPVSTVDLIDVGSLLVHAGPDSIRSWLAQSGGVLDGDLELAVEAFALAAAGDRKAARQTAKKISSADALPGRVSWALLRILSGKTSSAWPDNVNGGDPLEEGMVMGLALFEAQVLAKLRKEPLAAERLTRLFMGELNAPWPADFEALKRWKELLDRVQARYRWSPKGAWPSEQVTVLGGDSLAWIRKRYIEKHADRLICTGLIARSNGIREDLIHPDEVLRIPTDPVTMLVDLDAHWLLYFHGDEVVSAYPVGIGAEGEETIMGAFTIGEKQMEPTWFRRNAAPVVFGEEGNPLGTRYMTWFQEGRKTHFGFHGTWEPETIGDNKSQGCIRMVNGDVEEFFGIVPQGSSFFVQP